MELNFNAITTDAIPAWEEKGITAAVLRLDKIHAVISGNKWFKLRYYIKDALRNNYSRVVTFGGAYSNHIVAAAAACRSAGLSSLGIIRGEEPLHWSPTLLEAKELGMSFHFSSREEYGVKKIPASLMRDSDFIIPEGGMGEEGVRGAMTILDHVHEPFSHYACAVGTGTMMAGLISAAPEGSTVIGVSALKNNLALDDQIRSITLNDVVNWEVIHDFHFGGYAKYKPNLIDFMNNFFVQTSIPSDFVYTGKLFYGIDAMINRGQLPAGSRLLIVHSGGLQGNRSLEKGTLIF